MYRNSTKVAVSTVIAATVLALGWSATANAVPSANSSRLQLAEDNKANCQLLADSSTNTEQKARALACVADQDAIIALLTGPTVTPSPTTSPSASPSVTPSPSPTVTTTSPSPSPTATTPSPTPSTSTSGARLTNCFTQLAACGYPTINSTGVPAGSFLTARGELIANTPNAVYTNLRISGCVQVRAANVTIRNSIITGPCFYGIDMQSGSLNIQDSEINCVNGKGTGIAWAGFHALRVYIHDCENALEMGQGSSVEDSYLSSREATSDGHGDDIQSQGGNGVVIRHNTFAGVNPITSSIITNPTQNNGWLVELNFLSSGAFTLYCPENGTNFTVRNNRFYPAKTGNPHSASFGLTDACNHSGIIWSGNYRDDNLSVVGSNA